MIVNKEYLEDLIFEEISKYLEELEEQEKGTVKIPRKKKKEPEKTSKISKKDDTEQDITPFYNKDTIKTPKKPKFQPPVGSETVASTPKAKKTPKMSQKGEKSKEFPDVFALQPKKLSDEEYKTYNLHKNIYRQSNILGYYKDLLERLSAEKMTGENVEEMQNMFYYLKKYQTPAFFEQFFNISEDSIAKIIRPFIFAKNIGKYELSTVNNTMNAAIQVLNDMLEISSEKMRSLKKELKEQDLPFLSRDLARAEKRRKKELKRQKKKEKEEFQPKEEIKEQDENKVKKEILLYKKKSKKALEIAEEQANRGDKKSAQRAVNIAHEYNNRANSLAEEIGLDPQWPEN